MDLNLIFQSILTSLTKRYKLISAVSKPTLDDFRVIIDLAEQGSLSPVIDRTYRLSEIQQAHRHAETGHKKGNLVLLP
ncbi:MAG TPA: zinc-binding dehydrogenase, partial [Bacillota bacterium]|nr:zinc-binding dehydrogenase [Bacillota bacterium]